VGLSEGVGLGRKGGWERVEQSREPSTMIDSLSSLIVKEEKESLGKGGGGLSQKLFFANSL